MSSYASADRYLGALERRSVLPAGFRVATCSLSFIPREKPRRLPMNLSLILLDEPTESFAGCFTSNRFAGAPILIGRRRMGEPRMRGVLINNKIANVGSARGVRDAEEVLRALSGILQVPERELLAASTGIVGWGLPVQEMKRALPALVSGLRAGSLLPVARAIMTTDSYPKVRRARVGKGWIVAAAKGAGMIEPHVATMLVFILTDVKIGREELREALGECAERSFNRISVDSDQSTSDMVLAFSSGRQSPVPRAEFREALLSVCRALAEDIVRNGEGVAHVIRVRLAGLPEALALGMGKAIVNSPLVKTAVFGNDPNVGRLLAALGDYLATADDGGTIDLRRLTLRLGGTVLYEGGSFRLDPVKERQLARYLKARALQPERKGYPRHERCVDIDVVRGSVRSGGIEVLGADLSYEYVRENADYRS